MFLDTLSLLSLLLFPCSFPVAISTQKAFAPVFTRRWTRYSPLDKPKFPVFFPVNGNFSRDGFAGDCVHRQTVCQAENFRGSTPNVSFPGMRDQNSPIYYWNDVSLPC